MTDLKLCVVNAVAAADFPSALFDIAFPEGVTGRVTDARRGLPEMEGWELLVITDDAALARDALQKENARVVFVGAAAPEGLALRLSDVWDPRESEEQLRFRCQRVLHQLKAEFDLWFYRHTLSATIDTVPDMLWYKRLDGIHMLVNDAFTRIVQKPKSDVQGKDHFYIWDAPRPAEGNAFACAESEEIAISTGKTYICDEPVQTKEGLKQFTTYKTPLYDMLGNVFGTIGVGHDVTNFSNLGIELSILVENMPFPMTIFSADGKVVRMNKGFQEIVDAPDKDAFDYRAWKRAVPQAVGEKQTDEARHATVCEYRITVKGEVRSYVITELEIRDYFDNLSGYFITMQDITYRRAYEQTIIHAANTDVLTGMYNRRYFYDFLAGLSGRPFTLLYLDLDHFKAVNDRYGHAAGDNTLIETARLIERHFPGAVAARLGGDEFAVVDESNGREEIGRRCAAFEEAVRRQFAHLDCDISASVGVARTDGSALNIDELIQQGDAQMYLKKKEHHNVSPDAVWAGDPFYGLLENLIRIMCDLERFDVQKIFAALAALCKLLRVSKGVTEFFDNPAKERAGDGEAQVCYDSGEESEPILTQRALLPARTIARTTVYRAKAEAPWTPQEQQRIELIQRVVLTFVNRSRLRAVVEKLTLYDDNGYRNLRYYLSRLEQINREGRLPGMAAVRFNLRHFALINHQIDREPSSMVMRRFITGLEQILEEHDMVCRLGGDNFVLLCGGDQLDDVLKYLRGTPIVYNPESGERVMISAAAGVYVIPRSFVFRDFGDIMDNITTAYNEAKNGMMGDVVFSDEGMLIEKERVMKIKQLLPAALSAEEFLVYYQPKININTNELTGAEALCRWRHEGRLVPPLEFIPVLEQSLDICKLDFYMLDHVCRDIRRWLDEGKRVVRVSVNLSRRHMLDLDLFEHIVSIIDRHRVPHEYIEIELTETTTDVEFRDLKRVVNGLQEAGIRTSVDDFGIGYSSLNLLNEIPWNTVKVDKSILPTEDGQGQSKTGIMFRHVVHMANELGLECVAEGVETQEQIDLLKRDGCAIVQGFYYDRPLPVREFESRMERHVYR